MGARWYSPTSGGFQSRDTVRGELKSPISLNRYTYAAGNPVRSFDPDGHRHFEADPAAADACATGVAEACGIGQWVDDLGDSCGNGGTMTFIGCVEPPPPPVDACSILPEACVAHNVGDTCGIGAIWTMDGNCTVTCDSSCFAAIAAQDAQQRQSAVDAFLTACDTNCINAIGAAAEYSGIIQYDQAAAAAALYAPQDTYVGTGDQAASDAQLQQQSMADVQAFYQGAFTDYSTGGTCNGGVSDPYSDAAHGCRDALAVIDSGGSVSQAVDTYSQWYTQPTGPMCPDGFGGMILCVFTIAATYAGAATLVNPAFFFAADAVDASAVAVDASAGGTSADVIDLTAGDSRLLDMQGSATWGRPDSLAAHFADHGGDFGATTADEYAQGASDFFQSGIQDNVPMKIDPKTGTIRMYDPNSNTFGAFNANGTTRTFYAPNPAIHGYPTNGDYWISQPGHSAWGR